MYLKIYNRFIIQPFSSPYKKSTFYLIIYINHNKWTILPPAMLLMNFALWPLVVCCFSLMYVTRLIFVSTFSICSFSFVIKLLESLFIIWDFSYNSFVFGCYIWIFFELSIHAINFMSYWTEVSLIGWYYKSKRKESY